MSEISTRFLGPVMDIILVLIATTVLLKSSLLRRRGFNMAAPIAVAMMAGAQATFMASLEVAGTMLGFAAIAGAQILAIIILLLVLKGIRHKA